MAQKRKTPPVCALAGEKVETNESSTASEKVNTTLRRFDAIAARTLESKTSAIEQPGAEAKFTDSLVTRGKSAKAASPHRVPGTTARNAWPPFESYRVDANLLVEVWR